MSLSRRIEELKKRDLNCNVFSVYDYKGATMQELLCEFFTKINECIDSSNKTTSLVQWLLNEGLKLEVARKLQELVDDGTIENLINEKIFGELNQKINNIHVNVLDYGAKGDGVSDDTLPIKKALLDISKGSLFFPKGTYLISSKIDISGDNITILGNNSTLKCVGKTAGLSVSNSVKLFNINDLQIISNYESDNGIILNNIHQAKLNNVWVQGFNNDGIYVEGCFISTYENVTSIENKRFGLNFDSDMIDPSNNSIKLLNCNISKNGFYNLNIKSHFMYDIIGLNCEQFDYIECGGNRIYPKGAINIDGAKVVSIKGLYIESYMRSSGVNNFDSDYCAINLGTNNIAVEMIKIDNFYISNNTNSRVGIRLTKVRDFKLGVGQLKGCLKGIQNVDSNNTVDISPQCRFLSNSQDVDNDKKYFYTNKIHNFENVCSKVDIKGDHYICLKAKQNMYVERGLIYYLENTNAESSHKFNIIIGNETISTSLLPNKTAPYIQVVNVKKYINSGDVVYIKVDSKTNATGLLNFVLEVKNTY